VIRSRCGRRVDPSADLDRALGEFSAGRGVVQGGGQEVGLAGHGADGVHDCRAAHFVTRRHEHVRAAFRQEQGGSSADTARRTGHQDDTPGPGHLKP
jgi:hypothetical protein